MVNVSAQYLDALTYINSISVYSQGKNREMSLSAKMFCWAEKINHNTFSQTFLIKGTGQLDTFQLENDAHLRRMMYCSKLQT